MRKILTAAATIPATMVSAADILRPANAQAAHAASSSVASTEGKNGLHQVSGPGYRRLKTTLSAVHPSANPTVRLTRFDGATRRVYVSGWKATTGRGSLMRVSRVVTDIDIDRSSRRVIVIGLGAVLIASACSLTAWHSPRTAAAFLALSLATWLVVAATLWRARPLLGPHATRLGTATHLTLLRGLLVSLVAGFAAVSPAGAVRWLPALLYTAAAICDRFDGIIARRLGQTTALGARLDEAMDALGLLAAPVVAVSWGRLPPWYLLLGVTYYIYRAALWLRRRLDLPVHPERVRPKRLTRIFAGLQMTLVCVALAPVSNPKVTTIAATIIMMPTLMFFARDWLILIGRLQIPSPREAGLG